MIGLEFIAKTYNTEYKTIAQELGVTPVTIQHWLKGRKPIPEVRLQQLSQLFGLPPQYFVKELDTVEKIRVQQIHLQELARAEYEESEYTTLDERGDEITVVQRINPYEGEALQLYKEEFQEILFTRIRGLIELDNDLEGTKNFFLLEAVAKLLSDEDNRRKNLRLMQAVVYFAEYWGSGWGHPQLTWCSEHDSFFEELAQLVTRHKIV